MSGVGSTQSAFSDPQQKRPRLSERYEDMVRAERGTLSVSSGDMVAGGMCGGPPTPLSAAAVQEQTAAAVQERLQHAERMAMALHGKARVSLVPGLMLPMRLPFAGLLPHLCARSVCLRRCVQRHRSHSML